MDFALSLALVAVALAAAALVRSYIPPQRRAVHELTESVQELIEHVAAVDKRLVTRTNRENMDKARAVHEERKQRRDNIEREAEAILAAAQAAPTAAPQPVDEHSARLEIRRKIGLH